MSSAISPISLLQQAASPRAATTPPASTGTAGLANQTTFLTLLVSQLQNQDPLNPADSTQFVTQLAQFSQLEDLQNINTNVMAIATTIGAAPPAAPAPAAAPASGAPVSQAIAHPAGTAGL